ncbi:hypothetical protein BV22DRAFT_1183129 [Leucogyrophana mollusca]|uniref:Uncharacterized protein n=1 Tax=Leucogyrophana mollusca TaxID=85980 RepID=A0ACB8B2E2_9AGAM|nr:hypothetical protein BV22DRAFT_1183129 [Leucogyrophana mollusca]
MNRTSAPTSASRRRPRKPPSTSANASRAGRRRARSPSRRSSPQRRCMLHQQRQAPSMHRGKAVRSIILVPAHPASQAAEFTKAASIGSLVILDDIVSPAPTVSETIVNVSFVGAFPRSVCCHALAREDSPLAMAWICPPLLTLLYSDSHQASHITRWDAFKCHCWRRILVRFDGAQWSCIF